MPKYNVITTLIWEQEVVAKDEDTAREKVRESFDHEWTLEPADEEMQVELIECTSKKKKKTKKKKKVQTLGIDTTPDGVLLVNDDTPDPTENL